MTLFVNLFIRSVIQIVSTHNDKKNHMTLNTNHSIDNALDLSLLHQKFHPSKISSSWLQDYTSFHNSHLIIKGHFTHETKCP